MFGVRYVLAGVRSLGDNLQCYMDCGVQIVESGSTSVTAQVHMIGVAAAGPQGVSLSMNRKCHSAGFGGSPA